MEILIVPLCIIAFLGITMHRFMWWYLHKDWAKYEIHTCGKIEWSSKHPCPSCGEASYGEWKVVYARFRFFRGWQWKYPTEKK